MKVALTQEEYAVKCNEVLQRFGYIVIFCSSGTCAINEVLPGTRELPHPLVVMAEATREEFLEQCRFTDFGDHGPWPHRYYKVVAE